MKTFIVNLQKDTKRKEYIINHLKPYSFLDKKIIKAVYGKSLSNQELEKHFDTATAFKRYGRNLNPGEIGCTLSHFKCYQELINSCEQHVLILEDDITVIRNLSVINSIITNMPINEPWVLFLSADYWYTSLKKINTDFSLAKVYDAVGTYAYIINIDGAKLITKKNPKPSSVADNWSLYRRQGLKLYAIFPYLIDANIESFDSSIKQTCFGEIRKNMTWNMKFHAYLLSAVKKVLLKRGHFVSKIRIQ